ncbi:MAG: hypothetical protein IIA05_10930 [Proteobacteria bacterium]|nr:hypothetical protein [Pseudomonadota bacterium]
MSSGLPFLVIRQMVLSAVLSVWVGWLSINAASAQSSSAEETAYYGHWVTAAAELTNVAVILADRSDPADVARAQDLEASALRLDAALKSLLQTMPPEGDAKRYLMILPNYQECASAILALAESARRGDALEFEIARDWYVEALDRLRGASRQFSSSLEGFE